MGRTTWGCSNERADVTRRVYGGSGFAARVVDPHWVRTRTRACYLPTLVHNVYVLGERDLDEVSPTRASLKLERVRVTCVRTVARLLRYEEDLEPTPPLGC